MKITWLGQAGLLFEKEGKKILIDPYLSNSVAKIEPQNYRRIPVDEKFLQIKPDIIVLTHNHLDHTDPETLCHYLNENSEITVLASKNAWNEARKFGGAKNKYIMFNCGTMWTEKEIVFRAVHAEHSDDFSIGVILTINCKNYYYTGDTLYNESVFASLPKEEIEMLFLPVNGKGNNMNFTDARKLAERINAKNNIPIHIGLFDDLRGEDIKLPNKKALRIYESFKI